jgi:hypothetical protein
MGANRVFRLYRSDPLRKARKRLEALKARIVAREPLSDSDHRILAKCGPKTLAWLGYTPRVVLQ